MKKLICLVLIFVLMLTACSKWEIEIKEPDNSKIPENPENVSENILEETGFTKEEYAKATGLIVENLAFVTGGKLDGYYELGFVESSISVTEANIAIENENIFSFDLFLSNGGAEIKIPMKGFYHLAKRDSEVPNDAAVSTCGFCALGEDKIGIYGYNFVGIIDEITLELTELSPAPGEISGNVWYNGIMLTESGYAVLVTPMEKENYIADSKNETKLLFLDGDGKITESHVLKDPIVNLNRYFTSPEFTREMYIINSDDGRILECGNNTENIDNGISYYCDRIIEISSGEKEAVIYRYYDNEDYTFIRNVAVLYDKKAAKSFVDMGTDYIDTAVFEPKDGIEELRDDNTLLFTCVNNGLVIEIDFNSGKYDIRYEVEEKHLRELIDESSDGKYSLWEFAASSGGDAISYLIAFRNNKTGEINYVGPGGGMYGGGTEAGFLKNGDFYFTDYSELKVYSPEPFEIIFDAEENFPFGDKKAENGKSRYLLTFRRDPENFGFIVVYFERDDMEYRNDETKTGTYMIGFLDAEGNLIESYDTGCGVWISPFGIQEVSMRYSKEALTLVIHGIKGNDGFTGIFDMETKEFAVS